MAESVLGNNKSKLGEALTKERGNVADQERIKAIKKMSEKQLLQNICYDMDRVARLITTYFTVFAILFVIWVIFTFVGPFIQKAAGL